MNTSDPARFVSPDAPADVAVIVVTYNSEADIAGLIDSVRPDAAQLRLRFIVADNDSTDDTVGIVAAHDDVILVRTGGNRGYAGGINAAMRAAGDAAAVLILNPDLRVGTGTIRRMLSRLRSDASTGIVVPRILDEDGSTSWSLRREPGLLRAASDSLFGRMWQARPAALTEYIRDPARYESARVVDWATGAAMLIRRETADRVGPWDERFFLYSEETDYFRRSRAAGWRAVYEPDATVMHRGGGSGVSRDLVALSVVNRVRYAEKHHPGTAGLYRALVILGEQLRRGDPTHDRARWALWNRDRWAALPGPSWGEVAGDFPRCAVIIPAHNEEAVIGRTLEPLAPLAETGEIEVVVACNGCTDGTAAAAAAVPGVEVVDVPEASKTAALNAGDRAAHLWPRVYLDADIVLSPRALADVVSHLECDEARAARPTAVVDTSRSDGAVRRYYRARDRMPSMSAHLWGAGVYALSEAGHDRFGAFPEVIADDFYVDTVFAPEEKSIVDTQPVAVQAPRDARALLAVFTRARRGPAQQSADTGASTLRELARSVRGPVTAGDAATYAWFALRARIAARKAPAQTAMWERDETSRADAAAPHREDTAVDHVILTRFNLPTPGVESLVRAREGWLRERIDLFERYTVPSIARQTVQDFRWIIYLDPESPDWLIERLQPHIDRGLFTPLYREAVTWQDVAADARTVTGAHGSLLLTTNLDNDDAVAADFVERLQHLARVHRRAALYLTRGLISSGEEVYLRRDGANAFCSVVESWTDPQTAWRDWHTLLHTHFPVITDDGRPAWLQVVHGGNVSNRVRGVRVSPEPHRDGFGDALAGIPAPRITALAADRIVRTPLRTTKEGVRRVTKDALLMVVGKDGLDRIKSRLVTQ
ncbi:glycosyltransferase [Microbacterium paludicola]|uniref:glycosyltransferase n=1 Tax=Microbacterium paludicola TaxID=300019 RepID=UPI0021B6C8EB|nr:glycosyltransferase [Microbacterium paludicola]